MLQLTGCTLIEKLKSTNSTEQIIEPEPAHEHEKSTIQKAPEYSLAKPLIWKQEHTKAKLFFNVSKQQITAQVELTFTPHLASKLLQFNAVGFDFKSAPKIIASTDSTLKIIDIEYSDSLQVKLALSKSCAINDTLTIAFEYTATPATLYKRGLIQKKNEQGLYFINPEQNLNSPTQIWSQGEPESNSCWIPCIDAPNQKISQEFYLTIDTPYSALSNGRLVYMLLNNDGTRTYYWKQNKKHAPYLTMIAIGKYAIIEDEGPNDLPLYYYVEPEYAKYAKMTFGKTPEMIRFFEKEFGVKFPWDKYAQVCVREFVSGAMENTSATTIMNQIQQDSFSYNDYNYEDYIVHELAHQWFGDLVTSESWANITLNEAFATYAEFLWIEKKYGPIEAFEKLTNYRNAYFSEANLYVQPLINYQHYKPSAMFNRHSYQKGALFLHALRNHIGDDYFFSGIKEYLTTNAYKSTDIDHLRHAFEMASGQDLSFFFDQYAKQASHPQLQLSWQYIDSLNQVEIHIKQNQVDAGYDVFAFNLNLELGIEKENSVLINQYINQSETTFTYPLNKKPNYVSIRTYKNPLIEWQCSMHQQWPNMINQKNIETHYNGVLGCAYNWNEYSVAQKNSIINYNNSWGRHCKSSDLLLLTPLSNDSIYYDITPYLKSEHNYLKRKTITYLHIHSKLKTETLNSLYQNKTYHLKKACLNSFKNQYNSGTEQLLLNDLKKESLADFHNEILSILYTKGSKSINKTLQKRTLLNNENANYYNFYITNKDYPFFTANLNFYKQLKSLPNLKSSDFYKILDHLEMRVKTTFSAVEQIEALEKIDELKN